MTILSPHRRLRTAEAASYLSLSKSWLEKLRLTGEGPRYAKLGRIVAYDPADLAPSDPLYSKIEAWLLDDKFADLCEAVPDPREDYADYIRDMRRDDALLAAK